MIRAIEWLLCAALAVVGVSKIVSGHDASFVVPEIAFYILAALELLAAVGLAFRCGVTVAGLFSVIIAAGGSLLAVLYAGHQCGCLGVWVKLSPNAHLATASVIGVLGALTAANSLKRLSRSGLGRELPVGDT